MEVLSQLLLLLLLVMYLYQLLPFRIPIMKQCIDLGQGILVVVLQSKICLPGSDGRQVITSSRLLLKQR